MGEHGDEWEFQRIGTESEKSSVEKELHELREQLAKVEEWKKRKEEIDEELNRVWVDGGEELAPPAYIDNDVGGEEEQRGDEGAGSQSGDVEVVEDVVQESVDVDAEAEA
jgi:ATP-binding cassette subfamily D (ALD) long-chain fatty acid import protein